MKGHSLKLYHKSMRLDVRKFFFSQRIVDNWNSLPCSLGTICIEPKCLQEGTGQLDGPQIAIKSYRLPSILTVTESMSSSVRNLTEALNTVGPYYPCPHKTSLAIRNVYYSILANIILSRLYR